MNEWLDAEQRVERAQHYLECQRWDEAVTEFDAALAIQPNNPIWHAQRGYALEELGRDADAAAAYQNSLELDSSDIDVACAFGRALVRLGRSAKALEVFEDVARRDASFEPAYCHRIQLYAELGRHEQAEEVFYLAQQIDDECPDCFYGIGVSLAARAQFDRAIFCWKRTLELDPSYLGVHRRIGGAYRAKGEFEPAKEAFLDELREDPGNCDVLFDLAELALQVGDAEESLVRLRQLLELDSSYVAARILLGRLHLRLGHPDRALSCLQDVSLDGMMPGQRGQYECAIGEALLRLGRFAEAETRLASARKADASDLRTNLLLGDANLALDRAAPAADCYRRVLAQDAHNPFAHHRLAVCLLKLKQHDAAFSHCTEALAVRPEFAEAMYHAAIAEMRRFHWREARALLLKAERLTPENSAFRTLRRSIWRLRARRFLRSIVFWDLRRG